MSFTVALAGKGGVGKTTLSALAILHLHRLAGGVVLAVDADPNSNLGAKLGVEPGRTLGTIREELMSMGEEPPPSISKQEHIDYQIKLALKEGDGFDLLTMGRPEGPGCYCYVNNMLRTVVDTLSSKYEYIVIDNEAGLEHLSRRTTRSPDLLIVVCDASKASLDAAKRISRLADDMKIGARRKALVFNMLDIASTGPPASSMDRFDAVYSVRRSGTILSGMTETESLTDIPETDPAVKDLGRIIDSERKLRKLS